MRPLVAVPRTSRGGRGSRRLGGSGRESGGGQRAEKLRRTRPRPALPGLLYAYVYDMKVGLEDRTIKDKIIGYNEWIGKQDRFINIVPELIQAYKHRI